MPVKVFSHKGSSAENEQLMELVNAFIDGEDMMSGAWTVFMQSVEFQVYEKDKVERAEIDCLILRPDAIIIVDFKNYANLQSVTIDESDTWVGIDEHKEIEVKGGNQANPYVQAERTRRLFVEKLRQDKKTKKFFEKQIQDNWYKGKKWGNNRIASIVAFTGTPEIKGRKITKPWFNICRGTEDLLQRIIGINDSMTNVPPLAMGELANQLGFEQEYPLAKVISGRYINEILPGFKGKQFITNFNRQEGHSNNPVEEHKATSSNTTKQFSALADCQNKHQAQPQGLVYFPTVGKDRAVLNNTRVIVLPESRQDTPFFCQARNHKHLNRDTLEAFMGPARSYEGGLVPPGIKVVYADSSFNDHSYTLGVAVADQLARHQRLTSVSEAIMATGYVSGEHGEVSAIEYINEKAELLLVKGAEKQIRWFIYPEANDQELRADIKQQLIQQGVKLLAITEIEDLADKLWRCAPETELAASLHAAARSQSASLASTVRVKKPSRQWQFIGIGAAALGLVAAAALLSPDEQTTAESEAVVTVQQAPPASKLAPKINQAARHYQRDTSDWQRLKNLLELEKQATEIDIKAIDYDTTLVLTEARQSLDNSDSKLNQVNQVLADQQDTPVVEWQALMSFKNTLSKLDQQRLQQDVPEKWQTLTDKAAAWQRFELAEQIDQGDGFNTQERHFKRWQSLSLPQRTLFEQEYPEQYQTLQQHRQLRLASDQRLSQLQSALQQYKNNIYANNPDPAAWENLVSRANSLQTLDKQRATENATMAIAHAKLAKQQLSASDQRIAAMLQSSKAYAKHKKAQGKGDSRAIWRTMSDKANAIQALDIARMNSIEKRYFQFAEGQKESTDKFQQKSDNGVKVIM
ncbi:NERD domain-containing protein [Motilimonas sp. KMU-193]|uniref:NERD domain-containing protein n=1 Tax=Motilimonas sp. KMU-193 TaxID=3388668 RepID=UPI00396B2089